VNPSDVVDVDLLPEHKAPDEDMFGIVVGFVGDVVWTAWKTYLGLTDLMSIGVTKPVSFGAA
jgi:hypothetical protein